MAAVFYRPQFPLASLGATQLSPDLQTFFAKYLEAQGSFASMDTSPEKIREYLHQQHPSLTTDHLDRMYALGERWVDQIPPEITLFTVDIHVVMRLLKGIYSHTRWNPDVAHQTTYYDQLFLTLLQAPSFIAALKTSQTDYPEETRSILCIAAAEGLEDTVRAVLGCSGYYLGIAESCAASKANNTIVSIIQRHPKQGCDRCGYALGKQPRVVTCISSCSKNARYIALLAIVFGVAALSFFTKPR